MPRKLAPEDRTLKPAEASAVLGVKPYRLAILMDRGRLKGTATPGRHRRYQEDSVNALRQESDAEAEMLTYEQVAVAGGVSSKTVGRWVRDGKITPVPTSAGLRFRPEDVRALRGDWEGTAP